MSFLTIIQTLFHVEFFGKGPLGDIIDKNQWFIYTICFILVVDTMLMTMTKALNYIGYLTVTNIIEDVLMLVACYYWTLKLEWGIDGALRSLMLTYCLRTVILGLLLFFKLDWKEEIDRICDENLREASQLNRIDQVTKSDDSIELKPLENRSIE